MADSIPLWISIGISVLALAVTSTFSWWTRSDAKGAMRLERQRELHSWAGDLAEVFVVLLEGELGQKKMAVARLAVLIDFGRLYFPNDMGVDPANPYPKGRRSAVLDPLVETCERSGGRGDWDQAKIKHDWREFIDQLNRRTSAFAIKTSPEAEGRKQYRNP